jgi:hypothetical protein
MSDIPMPVPPEVPPSVPTQALKGPGSPRDTVGKGFLVVVLWNVGHLLAGGMTFSIGLGAVILAAFGLFELGYVIPLAVMARNAGERQRMKGIIIAGAIGFLLTCACWGTVLVMLSNAKF